MAVEARQSPVERVSGDGARECGRGGERCAGASGLPAWPHFDAAPYLARYYDVRTWTCWHLPRALYAAELGIDLPAYTVPPASLLARATAFEEAERSGLWREVDFAAEQFADLVLFRDPRLPRALRDRPAHVGVVIAPRTMLHVPIGEYTTAERHDGIEWRLRRCGLVRWRAL